MWHQTQAIGNLGNDPELRYTPSGSAVCSFSLAVNETWKDAEGEKKEHTTWYNVSAWGPLAKTCSEYLKKGRQVMVIGRPSARGYLSKGDGEARASLELRADRVMFLGSAKDSSRSAEEPWDYSSEKQPQTTKQAAAQQRQSFAEELVDWDDDSDPIPF